MADPVIPTPAAPAPAAVVEAPPDFGPVAEHEVVQEFTYAHLKDDEEPAEEVVAPEATPEAPVVPEVPARFSQYRKETGELDEEALEVAHTKAQEDAETYRGHMQGIDGFLGRHAGVRVAWMKAVKADGGTLSAADEAFLAQHETPAPAAPVTPAKVAPTKAQIKAKYDEIYNADGPAAAMEFWDEYVTAPTLKTTRDALEAEKARIAKEDADRRVSAQRSAADAKVTAETAEAAKAYPSLLVKSDKTKSGYMIKDPVVAKAFAEVNREMENSPVTMRTVLEIALHRTGRLGSPKAPVVVKAVPATVRVPASARSAPVAKPKLEPHEVVQSFKIVGYDD